MRSLKILGLCGSQRAKSMSAGLLHAACELAPEGIEVQVFEAHKRLPLFNPDMEASAPETAHALWDAVAVADAIIIASPEYAHGVTGTIKNTLDWLVGHPPFVGKPVAVFNPSYQSHHADEALKETLKVMSAELVADACVRIPVIGSGVSHDAIAAEPRFAAAISSALSAVSAACRTS